MRERERCELNKKYLVRIYFLPLTKHFVSNYNYDIISNENLCGLHSTYTKNILCEKNTSFFKGSRPLQLQFLFSLMDLPLPLPPLNSLAISGLTLFCGFPKTYTVCPRSSYPFYVVTYYIKWVTTSWTHSVYISFPFTA